MVIPIVTNNPIYLVIKTHSRVSAANKQKKTHGTQVCYLLVLLSCQIQPSVSSKLIIQFLPNLCIFFCLIYTTSLSKLKEITLAFLEIFVPENCIKLIFLHNFLVHTKLHIYLSHIKITYSSFDLS